jgi:hypothetical protein
VIRLNSHGAPHQTVLLRDSTTPKLIARQAGHLHNLLLNCNLIHDDAIQSMHRNGAQASAPYACTAFHHG